MNLRLRCGLRELPRTETDSHRLAKLSHLMQTKLNLGEQGLRSERFGEDRARRVNTTRTQLLEAISGHEQHGQRGM